MPKPSKSERKEDRIQILEREIANVKKKNTELQQQKTVLLNDTQLQNFLDELTDRIEWSTNRVVDEMPRSIAIKSQEWQENDGFSTILKWMIGMPFFVFAISIGYSLYNHWGEFWCLGFEHKISLFVVAIAVFDCIALGIEIIREKDRNYVVSLFSALVALIALILTLVK